jgi:hypothetical protein
MNKKLFILCFLAFLGFTFYFSVKSEVLANWLIDSQGRLIYEPEGQVLGRAEGSQTGRGQTVKIEVQERKQEREELRNLLRLEREGMKIKLQLTNELGEEIEIPEGTESGEIEIEEPEDQDNVKVRSNGNAFVVIRNKIGAQTNFPLMVNLETNELIVTTPKGSKVVTVLPDKAVENMLAANVLDQLGGKGGLRWLEYQEQIATESAEPEEEEPATEAGEPEEEEPATEAGEPEEATEEGALVEETLVEDVVTMTTTEDGTLAYEIPGIKYVKLFGMIKIKLQRTAVVSAETGELLAIQEDLLTRLLDLLSV